MACTCVRAGTRGGWHCEDASRQRVLRFAIVSGNGHAGIARIGRLQRLTAGAVKCGTVRQQSDPMVQSTPTANTTDSLRMQESKK